MISAEFKHKVYYKCLEVVEEKIAIAQKAVEDAKQAANQEERSTAGDKYDTARAMSHIDQDMYGKQLEEVMRLRQHLNQISIDNTFDTVQTGALVTTSNEMYFIAISIGAINVDTQQVMVISPVAPIAQKLLNKYVGDKVDFNGFEVSIEGIA